MQVLNTIKSKLEQLKSGAPPGKRAKTTKRLWPADHELTVVKAQEFLPPGAKLWGDQRCARFQ
eukprot:3136556-Amphidinium_carterae.1